MIAPRVARGSFASLRMTRHGWMTVPPLGPLRSSLPEPDGLAGVSVGWRALRSPWLPSQLETPERVAAHRVRHPVRPHAEDPLQ